MVSIIMPVYNVESYIEESISSVINQTYDNFELIIINDGSTDSSLSVLKNFLQNNSHARVRIIETVNKGLSAARNLGLQIALGDYIYFLDSDDFLEKQFLEKITKRIVKNNNDVIIFQYRVVSEYAEKKEELNTSGVKTYSNFSKKQIIDDYLLGNIQNYAWSYVAQKQIYQKNKIFFPIDKAYEDIVVFPKIIYYANNVSIVNNVLYNYRQRSNSITNITSTQKTIIYLSDYLSNVKENKKWMLKNFEINYKKMIYNYCLNHYIQIFFIAAQDTLFPYVKIIPLVRCIKKDRVHFKSKNISFKKRCFMYFLSFGFGKLVFFIIQKTSKRSIVINK